ncbi:MAG TPA: ribonuclease [Rhodobiaceae bacterium]|jgi:regulator of ribonuclease activity A|nr:ribonuclease [Rhodobiaceae bacterium]
MGAALFATTDIADDYGDAVYVLASTFQNFGGAKRFCGPAKTLLAFEDNTKVRAAVETDGDGRVLVVDGGASKRCALFGGNLAKLAAGNGWAGVIINGYVRDTAELAAETVGIKALGVHPRKSQKRNLGIYDVPVKFEDIRIYPGDWIYADEDGIIVSPSKLDL